MSTKKKMPQHKKFLLIGGLVVVLFFVAYYMMSQTGDIIFARAVGSIFSNLWWIILPIPVWKIFMNVWSAYSKTMWLLKQESVLLEIRPPADVEKSPKIMEQVFNGLHTWASPNKFEEYCGWRPGQDSFSFEIVSTEGTIHFYARCPKAARNNMEAQIYAQYPDAEIFEVEDYTNEVPRNLPNKQWDVWGSTITLVKEDPIPIRTYKQFQEDVTGKMIDPLASLTEVMGAAGKSQHIWFQILFSPAYEPTWHPKSQAFVDKMLGKVSPGSKGGTNPFVNFFQEIGLLFGNIFRGLFGVELAGPAESAEARIEEFNIMRLTPGEQEQLKAIHENMSKVAFNTSIRLVYLGKRENFNKALGVAGSMGALKQFADINLNALFPDKRSQTFANYYFTKSRLAYKQRKIIQDYRYRAASVGTYVFNTEELATVFHFPDVSVTAPTIQRIEAKKGEAPPNLPVEFEAS